MTILANSKSKLAKFAGIAALTALALTACASDNGTPNADGADGADGSSSDSVNTGTFESGKASYDELINNGPVAADELVENNAWAKAIRDRGVLKVGGTETSDLFSLVDPLTNVATGFDAGLTQLLARYIIGDAKTELTQVTVATREELVENDQVDLVVATYSITPERLARVDFAGPYYSSQAAILVKKDTDNINSVADLAGKVVATQASSTGVTLLEEFAPDAEILPLPDQAQALAAVQQGRADAYVIDQSLLMNAVVSNDDVKIVGEPFGNEDPYGVGVKKGSDAKEFVDGFLKLIEEDGTWLKLWKITLQERTGIEVDAVPPALGSAGN